MKAFKNTGLALAMSSMLCAAAGAGEMTSRVDLFHSTELETAQIGQPSQRVYLPAFPCALGELTHVELELSYVIRSELRCFNPAQVATQVSAEVSERIKVSRTSAGALIIVEDESSIIAGAVEAGQHKRLLHGFSGAKSYIFTSGFDAWEDDQGRDTVDLDVDFEFALASLNAGLAEVDYIAGARAVLSVIYTYSPSSGALALEDGPQRRASSPTRYEKLDAIKSQSGLA